MYIYTYVYISDSSFPELYQSHIPEESIFSLECFLVSGIMKVTKPMSWPMKKEEADQSKRHKQNPTSEMSLQSHFSKVRKNKSSQIDFFKKAFLSIIQSKKPFKKEFEDNYFISNCNS